MVDITMVGDDTARLFQSSRSQAVRQPKEHRFPGSEVAVKHVGNGGLLLPIQDPCQIMEVGLVPLTILPIDDQRQQNAVESGLPAKDQLLHWLHE